MMTVAVPLCCGVIVPEFGSTKPSQPVPFNVVVLMDQLTVPLEVLIRTALGKLLRPAVPATLICAGTTLRVAEASSVPRIKQSNPKIARRFRRRRIRPPGENTQVIVTERD